MCVCVCVCVRVSTVCLSCEKFLFCLGSLKPDFLNCADLKLHL